MEKTTCEVDRAHNMNQLGSCTHTHTLLKQHTEAPYQQLVLNKTHIGLKKKKLE